MESCSWYDVGCFAGWLKAELTALLIWCYSSIMSGVAAVFEAIPAPQFLLEIGSYTIPGQVAFFAQPFMIPTGVGMIVTAYITRFIVRRIPFIG